MSRHSTEEGTVRRKRELCTGGCGRAVSVCLCKELPPEPLHTATHVLILQHPHELRHKLATVPVLQKCLKNSQVIVGRRLQMGSSPMLDKLWHNSGFDAAARRSNAQVLLLFPGDEAVDLEKWVSSPLQSGTHNHSVNSEPENEALLLLVVFDGTWQHAKEMVKASMPFLGRFAVQVCLPYDRNKEGQGLGNSDLIMRKEPFGGCITTLEAVARSLGFLDPHGAEIEQKLLSVLRAMVAFQLRHQKPMKPRPRLLKKGRSLHQDKEESDLRDEAWLV